MSNLIENYLNELTYAVSFDPSLAQRLRVEAEDHLLEAVESAPYGLTECEAERAAIERFGSPYAIAGPFAAAYAGKQASIVSSFAVGSILSLFIAMKSRIAWYALVLKIDQPTQHPLQNVLFLLDRYTFWVAVTATLVGWIFSRSLGKTQGKIKRQLARQSMSVYWSMAVCVFGMVAMDICLTAARVVPYGWSLDMLVPALSVAIEMMLAVAFVLRVRVVGRRIAAAIYLSCSDNRVKGFP